MTKLGIIGFGKMAEALYKGAQSQGLISQETTQIHEMSPERISYAQTTYSLKNVPLETLIKENNLILVAIKPQQIQTLLESFPSTNNPEKCLISILAGTSVETYTKTLPNIQVARLMPNTPALMNEAATAIYFSKNTSEANKTAITSFTNAIGKTIEIETESQIDTITGISGSGPAFIYTLASAIINFAKEKGLNETQSKLLVSQTLIGAGKMIQGSEEPIETLIRNVTSPGGTTEAGLNQYNTTQINAEFISVIDAAIKRSKEL